MTAPSRKWWIAADPGVTGGAAILSDADDLVVVKSEVPLRGFAKAVDGLAFEKAMIEDLGGIPGDTPSTAFRLGTSFGIWQVQLYLVAEELLFVRPQKWQTRFARQFNERYCPRDRRERKSWIADCIRSRLPSVRKLITVDLADAVAMAWLLREGVLDDAE